MFDPSLIAQGGSEMSLGRLVSITVRVLLLFSLLVVLAKPWPDVRADQPIRSGDDRGGARLLPEVLTIKPQAPVSVAKNVTTHFVYMDGVNVQIDLPFDASNFLASDPTDVVQTARTASKGDEIEVSITVVSYGLAPPSENLPIAEPGSAAEYLALLRNERLAQGGDPIAAPSISLFGHTVDGVLSSVAISLGVTPQRVSIAEWVGEAGGRVWILRTMLSEAHSLMPVSLLDDITVSSSDLHHPSTSAAATLLDRVPLPVDEPQPPSLLSNLPFPSWWSGDCNVNNHPGSYPLGGSYRGVKACGPHNRLREVSFGAGRNQYEWQCPELSKRYLYLAYGVPPYPAHGKDVVWNFPGSQLEKVSNGTAGKGPHAGDVLSYGSATTYGHTSIVSSSNINSSGNGSITIVEQNWSGSGVRTHTVSNWWVQDSLAISGWLHAPSAPPPQPTLQSPTDGHVFEEGQSITLSWTGLGNEYYAEFWGGPGGTLNSGWQSGTSWAIGAQWAGYTYSWRVRARNNTGTGDWSGTRTFVVRPGAPTDLAAQAVSCTDSALQWSDNSGNEEGYRIYRDGTPIATVGADVTSFQDTSLRQDTTYSYVVRAYRGSILSNPSNTVSVTTPACAPGRPDLRPYTPSGSTYPVVLSSVEGTTMPSTLYAGRPTYFNWHFENAGDGPTNGGFYIELWVGDERVARHDHPGLNVGEKGSVSDWSYTVETPGTYMVRFIVDADHAIAEFDKSNNVWEQPFTWHAVTWIPYVSRNHSPTPIGTPTPVPTIPPTPVPAIPPALMATITP
jgi:hypothetical protein